MDRKGSQKDIPIVLEGFEGRGLRYRPGSLFRRGSLILDEQAVKREHRKYTVRDNQAREVQIRLKSNHIDPIPKIEVGGKVFPLGTPLKWYEYGWAGLPLLLVHAGGALGGACGGAAAYRNVRVFRSDRSTARKYLVTGATSVLAVIAYLVAVVGLLTGLAWYGSAPPHFASTAWARRTLHELTLEAPFDFDPDTAIAASLSPELREAAQIDSYEVYRNRGTQGSFIVLIQRFAYKPGNRQSLDGVVAGAMAKVAGDGHSTYASKPTTISGLEARSASYQGTDSGHSMRFDLSCAARGDRYWCVHIVYSNEASGEDARRILESVAIGTDS
jgi:hypothetical protein